MQPDQSQPTTFMDRFCTGWALVCSGIFFGFASCLMYIDSGHRIESPKLWIIPALMASMFVSVMPRLLLDIARRIRQIRKLKWS